MFISLRAINGGSDHGPSPTAASKATTFVKNLWRKSQAPSPSASETPGGVDPSPESFWSEYGGESTGLGIKWSPADTTSNGRFSSSQENGHISMGGCGIAIGQNS